MATPRHDRSSQKETLLRFLRDLPLAVLELERAVVELLDSFWEEPFRRRALELSVALAQASTVLRLSHVASVARSISSLLNLRLEDTFSIQRELREKLVELLGLLKDVQLESEESA